MKATTIIAVVAIVAVVGGIYAYSEYSRAPAGAEKQKVTHVVTSDQLLADFQQDETSAELKYVGMTEQVIEVTGTIREIDPSGEGIQNVILETSDPMAGVVCEFIEQDLPDNWKAGDQVTIRGFCKGMLMDVLLQRCVAV